MKQKHSVIPVIVEFFSSIFSFLGVITCCGLPILAGILATLGIGASQLSFFIEYRMWFIGLAIASLLFGFYKVYFRTKNVSCCEIQNTNS